MFKTPIQLPLVDISSFHKPYPHTCFLIIYEAHLPHCPLSTPPHSPLFPRNHRSQSLHYPLRTEDMKPSYIHFEL
jgi:hypothetical protein